MAIRTLQINVAVDGQVGSRPRLKRRRRPAKAERPFAALDGRHRTVGPVQDRGKVDERATLQASRTRCDDVLERLAGPLCVARQSKQGAKLEPAFRGRLVTALRSEE